MPSRTLFAAAALAAALAAAGCDDAGPTAPATADATVDLAPPAVPTGLAALGVADVVKLAWRPNTTDPDLLGYRVYRVSYGHTKEMAFVDAATPRWVDPRPVSGTYRYAVTAVDAGGNESAWTTVTYSTVRGGPDLAAAP